MYIIENIDYSQYKDIDTVHFAFMMGIGPSKIIII